jgi:hypothetical protein
MPTTNRTLTAARWALIVLTVAGLAIDAYVHFDLASTYDPVKTSTISQGDLFRAESVVAIIAAVALVARPRRYTAGFAALVAASGAAAIFVYRYYDLGKLGPIPSMYEPIWYPEKTSAAVAEVVATGTALGVLVLEQLRHLSASRQPNSSLAMSPN